jgi:hypothetical protein
MLQSRQYSNYLTSRRTSRTLVVVGTLVENQPASAVGQRTKHIQLHHMSLMVTMDLFHEGYEGRSLAFNKEVNSSARHRLAITIITTPIKQHQYSSLPASAINLSIQEHFDTSYRLASKHTR